MYKIYKVGGCVRDSIMGLKPKDIDYAVECPSFDALRQLILSKQGKIFKEDEAFLTIRAIIPELGAQDFVVCRKDGIYKDNRHPENVGIGTIYEDLARRDFTVNAIAQDVGTGEILDPYNGKKDIQNKVIQCVGSARDRFDEDALRMLRAIRFAITKKFTISSSINICLHDPVFIKKLESIPKERIYEELIKCFKYSTIDTLKLLDSYDGIKHLILNMNDFWLKPTFESR